MKGRTCANGQKQCKKAVLGDVTSPTVSTESAIITASIDANEVPNFGICDIPGAFLSADMDEDVKMALRGGLVELIVNIASQIYRQRILYEKVGPVLYIKLNKALYVGLILTFLFYERLVEDPRCKGFEFNP